MPPQQQQQQQVGNFQPQFFNSMQQQQQQQTFAMHYGSNPNQMGASNQSQWQATFNTSAQPSQPQQPMNAFGLQGQPNPTMNMFAGLQQQPPTFNNNFSQASAAQSNGGFGNFQSGVPQQATNSGQYYGGLVNLAP